MNSSPRRGVPVSIRNAGARLLQITLLLLPAAAGAGGQALTVSPGEIDRASQVAGACPTFLWSSVEGATGYELAVFDLAEPEAPRLILSRRIEGSAPGWTPGSADCLEPGKAYAWTVRALPAVAERAAGGLGSADREHTDLAWSQARRFQVSGAPSTEEVAAALEVLRRWQTAQGFAADGAAVSGAAGGWLAAAPGGSPALARRPAAQVTGASGSDGASTSEDRSVAATGTSAIRGELPDTTGATFGVTGISHSTTGAGLVAINDTAGADLILDGEANGATDTALTQSGLDRSSAAAETFNFQNSGTGAMSLQIDGVTVVTTATDQNTTYTAGNQLSLSGNQFNVSEGSGSGLNADTLDGLNSLNFAPSAHSHSASEINDEPGVASDTAGSTNVSLDGTVQTLLSRSLTTPAAGHVLVVGTCQPSINHTNGTLSWADFGVSDAPGVLPVNQDVRLQLTSEAPTGTYYFPVTVHGLFSVPAGVATFYLLAEEAVGAFTVNDMQLTLLFVPTAYGTVESTALMPLDESQAGTASEEMSDD